MFGTLLESRARRERGGKGAAVSAVVHAVIIVLAVAATATARPTVAKHEDSAIRFVKTVPPPQPPTPPVHVDHPLARGPVSPVDTRVVIDPPVNVPTHIPPIDYSAPPTDDGLFRDGAMRPGELPPGTPTTEQPAPGQPWNQWAVDKPVVPLGSCALRYPDLLRSAGIEGKVLAQFVVDADGKVEPSTFKALDSSHELFTQAVKACVASLRFAPAEAGGQKVRQLVQQPYVFSLDR